MRQIQSHGNPKRKLKDKARPNKRKARQMAMEKSQQEALFSGN